MSTEFFNDQWRIPSNENQNKVSNYSMSFDGTNYVQIGPPPNNTFLQRSEAELNATGYSVSAWIKIDSSFASIGGIFANDGIPQTGIVYGLEFKIMSDRTLRIDKGDGTGRFGADIRRVITAETVPLNAWTHVAFVLPSANETTWQIYINGVPSTLSIGGSGGAVGYSSIYSGGIGKFRFSYFQGQIDQLSIFDYALSSSQVSTLYGGGTAITNPMSLSPKPIAYYQLGDQSVDNGANYLVPNNSLSDYVFDFPVMNYTVNPDKIFLNNQAQVFNNATNFSFSGWFKINVDRNQNIFEIKDGSNYRFNINYYYYAEALRINIDTSGAGNYADAQNLISDGKIAIGEWFHYAGVFNGSGSTNADRTKLYINGQEQTLNFSGTQATSLGAIGATNTISLGNTLSNFFIQFGGQASNIQMWDASLSSPEVTTLYNNGSPYTGTQPQSSNLRFWYKLNAADTFNSSTSTWTIKDYAGSNDATSDRMTSANLVVSDLQQTSGYSPYALDFDGADDYLDANRTVASNLDFSVSAWINPTSHDTAILGTRGLASAGTSNGFTININSSGNFWGRIFTETSNIIQVQTGSTISLNNWSHVAMTYNSSSKTLKTYLNGSEVGSIIGTDSSVTSTAELNIGRASIGTFYDYFVGKLSNVALWNTNLTSTEVTEVYNQGIPGNLHNFSGTAPVAWWQLGSNSSFNTNWTCLDEIGTNNAVSVNMANNDIVDGVGYSASGLGTSSIDIKGDAPYSTANGLSRNMDVLDRTTDVAPS